MQRNEIIVPQVHLNGTSEDDLLEGPTAVILHLREALDAFKNMRPNGRDYYCHPEKDAMSRAEREQHIREMAVHNIVEELEAMIGGVLDRSHTSEYEALTM